MKLPFGISTVVQHVKENVLMAIVICPQIPTELGECHLAVCGQQRRFIQLKEAQQLWFAIRPKWLYACFNRSTRVSVFSWGRGKENLLGAFSEASARDSAGVKPLPSKDLSCVSAISLLTAFESIRLQLCDM